MSHRLIEDGPLCAAAAIHRGQRTVAMLDSGTSHRPVTRGNLGRGPEMELVSLTVLSGGNYPAASVPISGKVPHSSAKDPHPPGSLHEYQNKGDAGKGVC